MALAESLSVMGRWEGMVAWEVKILNNPVPADFQIFCIMEIRSVQSVDNHNKGPLYYVKDSEERHEYDPHTLSQLLNLLPSSQYIKASAELPGSL